MKENSRERFAKIFGIAFLIILVSLLIFRVLKDGIYSSKMGMNIAVVGKDSIGLLLLRPDEEIVGWVTFPNNLTFKIFNSEAKYPAVSLWDYGVMERNPYEILEKSVGLSMGVTIARVIKIDGVASVEGVLAGMHKLNLKTDLSIRDRFLIRKFLVEAESSKKVLEMDVPKKVFDETEEPDGKKSLVFNSVASLWTKNKFVLESILSENVDLIVNNVSGKSGFGTQVARQLESSGMRVVEVKSDEESTVSGVGCLFRINGDFPYTESLLVNQMRCKKIDDKSVVEKGITVWLKN